MASQRSVPRVRAWPCALVLMLATGLAFGANEPADIESSSLPRHALERRALVAPDEVLRELPAALAAAQKRGDARELALLQLARANACRVVADWNCQREAGLAARRQAESAGDGLLEIRGLIAESRARIALQDYTQGERLLGLAELALRRTPSAELAADVDLAYSSLSFSLGKHALAATYAERGLSHLGPNDALPMQVRLLRNLGRALAQQNRVAEGREVLGRALATAARFTDPKLRAELHLESARLARLLGDEAAQRENGARVLELGKNLRNSQLDGLGREVIGLAALDAGKLEEAAAELQAAIVSFRALNLHRDELRVARTLTSVLVDLGRTDLLGPLVRRFIELDRTVLESERAAAADDFDARLKYAEQELEVTRLEGEARLAEERARALAETNRLTRLAVGLALATVLVLAVFFVQQRRSNRRLRETLAALRESEARATDLLRLSTGFVFLHDRAGRLLMVNPATADALGHAPPEMVGRSLRDFMPPDAAQEFDAYLERVEARQRDEGTLRLKPPRGGELHWRYSNRLSETEPGRAYVIGHAVDVTAQIVQAMQLREQSERDALTGSWNRRWLDVFEQGLSPSDSWAVINVDLDRFKDINDTFGHDAGDRVLVSFARFLDRLVREGDAVVRAGGDEFLILLPHSGQAALDALLQRLEAERAAAPCGFSIGAAVRQGDEPLAGTLARADAQMYEGRRARRATR